MFAFKHSAVSFGTPDMPPPGLGSSIGPISLHNAICRSPQASRCVRKKHNTPRNTTTPPAVLCPLGRGYAELRHNGVLRSSASGGGTLQGKEGDVVLLLPALPYKGVEFLMEELL